MSNQREIMTFTGKMFDFFRPDPATICITDIAHHLACINRYTGATRVPYSVAEHCVRMSYLPIGDSLLNLMHDSAEAYIHDIASPQKGGLGWLTNGDGFMGGFFLNYRQIEAEILRKIGKALGIPKLASQLATPKDVKEADLVMLATEVRDLMPPQGKEIFRFWTEDHEPLPDKIVPWDWATAEENFLCRHEELMR